MLKSVRPGKALLWSILLVALGFSAVASAQEAPQVELDAGTVSGIAGDVVSFQGIPYAAPPVGELRWRAPAPVAPWDGVLEATGFGPACMQRGDIEMDEDCLFINVWAPAEALESDESLPVLVWTFGGSFHSGSGNIDGAALASKGAIVVSMNYRVSTMGFLAHPGLSAESLSQTSGNYGLLDVIQALRWTKTNIAAFGGDPERVTIWGLSSGASLITALMVSPLATDLFDQAILQSPGAMRSWNALETAEQQGLALGEDIAALRALPASEIEHLRNVGGGSDFRALALPRVIGPALDGFVLPALEREAFEAGRANNVPLLIGNVTDEGGTFTRAYEISTVDDYKAYLSQDIIFGEAGDEAFALYPVGDAAEIPGAVAASFGDNQFVFGTRGVARAVSDAGLAVYRYMFTRPTEGGTGQAPGHGYDLDYAFGDAALQEPPYTDDDRALSETIMDAWLRFAATGNPNGGDLQEWPAYDSETEPVLVFDVETRIVNAPDTEKLDFMGERWANAQR